MMKVTVRQISISSRPQDQFYLKLEWDRELGSGFVMVLCDGVSAWSGEVSEEDVSREAEEMEMLRERYVDDLQQALTSDCLDAQRYRFHVEPGRGGDSSVCLAYEKVQSDISFRLGTVELLPVLEPCEVIREMIAFGLERSSRLQEENLHLKQENRRLREEQQHLTAEMERYVEVKETLERDLYSRFVLVLNEKKSKIRALQQQIKELQSSIEEEKKRLQSGQAGEQGSAEEKAEEKSDYGSTTEEEKEEEEESRRPNPPQTSEDVRARVFSSPMDESLSDITDVAPSRKRRQRHLQPPPPHTKRPAVDQTHSARAEPPGECKASKAPTAAPDPHELFDDI